MMRWVLLTSCAGLCATATATPPTRQSLLSEEPRFRAIEQAWGFADVRIDGDMLYLSGVVAQNKAGAKGLEAGYEEAFRAIDHSLERAGAGWADVVDITSFHTNLAEQMPAIVAVKNRYVHAPFPAWTAVQVVRLIPDDGITEIKIVARRRLSGRATRR